jgi:hypothetical protein
MLERFWRAMRYWLLAVSHPGDVLDVAQRDLHRVRIGFYIILVFSILYSLTALLLWSRGRVPLLESWVPGISPGEYYLYQAFWTLPWMVVAWLGVAGLVYLFTSMGGKEAFYEDSLMISALSISIPYLMFWWIPETFLLPAMGPGSALRWPELFELERKYAFPGLWQLLIVAFGMRKLNNTGRHFCILAGLLAVGTFLGLYLPFMR